MKIINPVLQFPIYIHKNNYKIVYNTPDLHNSEKVHDNIETEFEQLFLNKHNKNINYIEIEKIS